MLKRLLLICLMAVGSAGCSDVPREAVVLSTTVGKDLAEVHRAHRAIAVRYYGRIKADANALVDQEWRPRFVEHYLRTGPSAEILRKALADPQGKDPIALMTIIVEEAMMQVEAKRRSVVDPIEAREQQVLQAIDDAYQRLRNAQAVVTAHLASVRKVQEAQDEFLAGVGAPELRAQTIDATVRLSEGIADAVTKARRADSTLDDVDKEIRAVQAMVAKFGS